MPHATVTLADIEEAAANLDGVIRELPLAGAQWLERLVGGDVRLVTENLQRAGSFKIRGAYHRISRLSEEERARGVVAASAGNHAQGVAVAAQLLGVRATVFMPEGATIPKVQATLGYGADVRFHGDTDRPGARGRAGVLRARPGRCSSTRSTMPTSSRARALSAWRSWRRCPGCAPSWCAPAAAACSRASRSP